VGVSVLGSEVTVLALPLTAVAVLHASAGQVALLAAAGTAPYLLLGLPAGAWVDRWPRRSLMVGCDVARAVLLASVPAAYALGGLTLGHLLAVTFAAGALGVFFDVAALSVLPALVPRADLPAANGSLEAARAVAQTGGPAAGGVLVDAVTGPGAVLVDAVSFLVSAVLLRGLPPLPAPPRSADRPGVARQVTEGLAFCLRHPVIRALAAGGAWINFWTHALLAVVVTHAVRDLGLSAAAIGVVLAVSNVGYLLGSVLAPRLNARIGLGPAIVVAVVLHGGLVAAALAPASGPLPWLIAGFGVQAVGAAVWNVDAVSLRQAATPDALLARMNATNRFLLWGAMPLGAAAGGGLATAAGLPTAVLVAAVAVPLCALPLLRSAVRRVRVLPASTPPEGAPAATS
jgi:MFS family permease